MDITNIKAKDLSIFSCVTNNNSLYLEYCGGYEDNYYNELEIDLKNFTYTSKIKDINKLELAKVFNKLYLKLKFDDTHYRQYSIIQLWNNIKSGVDTIIKRYNLDKYINVINFARDVQHYLSIIGNTQINVLAEEYNNVNENIIDTLINQYYLLYLQYSYQLFHPLTLSIEHTTNINPLFEKFYAGLTNDINNYDPDDFIIDDPEVSLINQYLLFAQSFVFQFTKDLKNNFFD